MSNAGIGARLKIQFHRGTIVTVQKLSRHEFLVLPLPSMLGSRSSEQWRLAILRCLRTPTESGIGLAVWKGRHSFMKVAKMGRVSQLAAGEFILQSCSLGIGATSRGRAMISKVRFVIGWIAVLLFCIPWASAQDPCHAADRRALILSCGGVKGAFGAGAVYHLVALRVCDCQA